MWSTKIRKILCKEEITCCDKTTIEATTNTTAANNLLAIGVEAFRLREKDEKLESISATATFFQDLLSFNPRI